MKRTTKRKEKLESEIVREICEYLESEDFLFWRQNNIPVFGMNNGGKMVFRKQSKYTPKGIPDILLVIKGQLIGIEVKRPGREITPEQKEFSERLKANGGDYIVAWSLANVQSYLHYKVL